MSVVIYMYWKFILLWSFCLKSHRPVVHSASALHLAALTFTAILSFHSASALAGNSALPEYRDSVVFKMKDATHIVEDIPSMGALFWNAMFWLSLNLVPDIAGYMSLQMYRHLDPSASRVGLHSLNAALSLARHLVNIYKVSRLSLFAWAQTWPVISQTYHRANCLQKIGTTPVYILDSTLARTFAIKVRFNDQGGAYAIFHVLEPDLSKASLKLPRAWQKLFEQLHQLPNPVLYVSLQTLDQLPALCLGKTSAPSASQECDILLPVQYPARTAQPVLWDLEMMGQWCPQNHLKASELGYSIFSTSVIDAIAEALAAPEKLEPLSLQTPNRIVWQGHSAALDSTPGFAYQVGWSGTALNPGSPGFITLAPQNSSGLTPEEMENPFSNWQHWASSYQKHWPATPLQWLTTLTVNRFSENMRRHIQASSWQLIQDYTTSPVAFPALTVGSATPPAQRVNPLTSEIISSSRVVPPFLPPFQKSLMTGNQVAPASTSRVNVQTTGFLWQTLDASQRMHQPYARWEDLGLKVDNQVLAARTIALELSEQARAVGHYRSETEIDYLHSSKRGPKPVTILVPGVPIELHESYFDLALLLAIPPKQVLAPYKKNVNSNAEADLDSYDAKRHPGMRSFFNKIFEMNQRRNPFLVDSSWGGINVEGETAAPKLSKNADKYYGSRLRENEVIVSSYEVSNIKGFIITNNTPLLFPKDNRWSLLEILKQIATFEEAVGLRSLPVYFYNQNLGQIVDVISFTPETLKCLKDNLATCKDNRYVFGNNALKLPAFFGTWHFYDYLNQVKMKQESFPDKSSGLFSVSKDMEQKVAEFAFKGSTDTSFFESLAQYPLWLMQERLIPIKVNTLAGMPVLALTSTPLKMMLTVNCDPKVTPPDKLISAFQTRSQLINEFMDKAGVTEKFCNQPVTVLDIFSNPYAALDKITKKGCPVVGSGAKLFLQALQTVIVLKDHPGEQQQYFTEVIQPLYEALLSKGKLGGQQWLYKQIDGINYELLTSLAGYARSNIDRVDKSNMADIRILIDQCPADPLFDPKKSYFDDIQKHYNELAILYFFYMSAYGGSELIVKSSFRINYVIGLSPPAENGVLLTEIPKTAFYPPGISTYQSPDVDISEIDKAFKESVANEYVFFKSASSAVRAGDIEKSKVLMALARELAFLKMQAPEDRSILSMLFLVKTNPGLKEMALAAPPPESAKSSMDNTLAKGRPYPLKHSMTLPLNQQLQQAIEHFYLNPNPAQVDHILNGHTLVEEDTLWREHHGVDHIARTVIILEATIQFHKELAPEYANLFQRYPDLERLLSLAMVYHDAVAEVAEKPLEEILAYEILERDLEGAEVSTDTRELVLSALKNKNVNTMNPVREEYTPDEMISQDERLIRRLLRIPDSVDIARVKAVSQDISFTPLNDLSEAVSDDSIYSMHWMDLDPRLSDNQEYMEDWANLMRTAVFWASLTGASPQHPNPAALMPYSVNPNLVKSNPTYSYQQKKVISRASDSLNDVRETLNDIARLFVAGEAGKTVKTLYQLRQIELPENWSTLDSFLHFTEARKEKLHPVINAWENREFSPHLGTLTKKHLSQQAVINALPPWLSAEKTLRQRGYTADACESKFEETWELVPKNMEQ